MLQRDFGVRIYKALISLPEREDKKDKKSKKDERKEKKEEKDDETDDPKPKRRKSGDDKDKKEERDEKKVCSYRSCDMMELRRRYQNLYIPSDFFDAQFTWVDAFPMSRPFQLGNYCNFYVMHREVDPIDKNAAVLDPPDADHLYSAKVMLMASPSMEDLYHKSCALAEDPQELRDGFQHPARLVKFLVGMKGKDEAMAIGGHWSPSLDGPDPEKDPSVLIKTAIRCCKALTGIDLSVCTQWYRFAEIRYHRPEETHKGRTVPAHVETVVLFFPDVWHCLPTRSEWETLSRGYKQQLVEKLQGERKEADGEQDEEEKDDGEAKEISTPTHWSKLDPKTMKVNDLRKELESRTLSSKGLKSQLIARLTKQLKVEEQKEEQKELEKSEKEEEEEEDRKSEDDKEVRIWTYLCSLSTLFYIIECHTKTILKKKKYTDRRFNKNDNEKLVSDSSESNTADGDWSLSKNNSHGTNQRCSWWINDLQPHSQAAKHRSTQSSTEQCLGLLSGLTVPSPAGNRLLLPSPTVKQECKAVEENVGLIVYNGAMVDVGSLLQKLEKSERVRAEIEQKLQLLEEKTDEDEKTILQLENSNKSLSAELKEVKKDLGQLQENLKTSDDKKLQFEGQLNKTIKNLATVMDEIQSVLKQDVVKNEDKDQKSKENGANV
uniref:Cell division cycle and apoptosis regulator protein 1 n=1 Tax=Zonotrichia albicollis TaxID=44394 RepID=A0A8D2N5Z2_ZONAL